MNDLSAKENYEILKRACERFEAKKRGDLRTFARLAWRERVKRQNVRYPQYQF